jgi:hypothetical protein
MNAVRYSETSLNFLRTMRLHVTYYSIVYTAFLFQMLTGKQCLKKCSIQSGKHTDPEVLVRFAELPDFLSSSGSGTRSTQPHEYKRGASW